MSKNIIDSLDNINKLIENTADGTYVSILNITKAIKKELSTIFK